MRNALFGRLCSAPFKRGDFAPKTLPTMSILHVLSTLVLVLIAIGVMKRKTTRIHLKLMTTAFLLDVGMVLYIEVTRNAVEQTLGGVTPFLMFHIVISIGVLVAYVFQLQLGRRLLKGVVTSRVTHLWVGVVFCALRLTNYVTSFYI